MIKNRRKDERVAINLPARWDGLSGKNEARIEDLSMSGCFVNTRGRVDVGEIVVVRSGFLRANGCRCVGKSLLIWLERGLEFCFGFSRTTKKKFSAN